jgi:homogentisate phytyltransferase/homogentisate geranylgeranyltransferase
VHVHHFNGCHRTTLFATTRVGDISAASNTTTITNGAEHSNFVLETIQKPILDDERLSTSALPSEKQLPFYLVLWRFTRPHTLIGSAVAIPALHALAAPSYAAMFTGRTFVSSISAMIPALLMNLYITGLNQITDVDIDKINKPYLPIVAGQLAVQSAKATVAVALVCSLLMGALWPFPFASQGLNVALWGSAILGTAYSLPPFRLKRHPFLAAFCIVAVRGTIINAGFFAHARAAAFGDAAVVGAAASSSSVLHYLFRDPKCILSSLYFAVFGIVIAIMKDVPDVKGDRSSNVRTFPVRLGQRRVFHTARLLLTSLLWGVGAGFFRGAWQATSIPVAVCRSTVAAVSILAGLDVQLRGKRVDPRNSKQVFEFYMHLWKIFYTSYVLLPFAR